MRRWPRVLAVVGAVGLVALVFHMTFIAGSTGGPDFLEGLRSGSITPDSVKSIEVIIPADATTPFDLDELEAMKVEWVLTERPAVDGMLDGLATFGRKRIHQNHPGEDFRRFLRVNTDAGFYLLYCSVHSDANTSQFTLRANTLNATNPNGGNEYYSTSFAKLREQLQPKRKAK
jgi:hypothetical protein